MRTHAARLALSAAAVAVVTVAIYGLDQVAPVLSLGGLYLFAVLPVAVFFGLGYALAVSVASMLAFNFFFLPPLHTFALTDSSNWVALAVYLVTAVVVSELAALSRRRAIAAADAEALRRSDAVKTAILHAVSHDLRSPLTAIRAASGGLESSSLDLDEEDRAALLETIRLETARLERLVANLLDLSRLQAGAAQPQPELWAVDELVSRALETLGPEADRVRVRLAGEATGSGRRRAARALARERDRERAAPVVTVRSRRRDRHARRRRGARPHRRPRAGARRGRPRADLRAFRAGSCRRARDRPRTGDRARVR
jgi:K+-sensing histidine kinase KdpD